MSQEPDIDINAMDYYYVNNQNNQNNNGNNNLNNNLNNNIYNNINIKLAQNPCNRCSPKFTKCETCNGFFLPKFYHEKHRDFCISLHNIYQEKTDLVTCSECSLLVKFSLYSQHLENCSSTNFQNQKLECQHCKKKFALDVIEEHENMCAKTLSDMMLLKETADCSFCKEKVSLLHIESHELSCKKIKENQDKIDKMLEGGNIDFPDYWEKSNPKAQKVAQNIYLVPLNLNSDEFFKLQEMFYSTLGNVGYNICNVWRVQNLNIWEKYHREKLRIKTEKNFVEEKLLFFGHKTIKGEHICKNGFDISFAVDNANYGRGLYFKLRADKVIDDAYKVNTTDPTAFIFVANVLTGMTHVQPMVNTAMKKPPFYDQGKFIYYDSVTNVDNYSNRKDLDQTYVVYNNEKSYPLYMIEFNNVNKIY